MRGSDTESVLVLDGQPLLAYLDEELCCAECGRVLGKRVRAVLPRVDLPEGHEQRVGPNECVTTNRLRVENGAIVGRCSAGHVTRWALPRELPKRTRWSYVARQTSSR